MKRRIRLILVSVFTLAALGYGGYLLYDHLYLRPYRELREAAGYIQLAIERFALDSDGNYPTDLQQLVETGYLREWPDNPFASGKMKPLKLSDQWEPGGFVYVFQGPVIAMLPGNSSARDQVLVHEIDSYLVGFYGKRQSEEMEEFAAKAANLRECPDLASLTNIEWSRVDTVLGSDHLLHYGHPPHAPVI